MKINQLTETEAAYIAGIIDGEGTIRMTKCYSASGDRKLRYRVYVQVAVSTSMEIVEWLVSKLDASMTTLNRKKKSDKHRLAFAVYVSEVKGEALLRRVLPYLVIKKRQAELFLRYREVQKVCNPALRWSKSRMPAVRAVRDWYYSEFRKLNAKGPESVTTNTPGMISEDEIMKIESELHGDMQRASGDTAPPTTIQ